MKAAPSPTTARIGWELHGVRVNFQCASEEVDGYVRAHLGPEAIAAHTRPDLSLTLEWHWGPPPSRAPAGGSGTDGAPEAGERIGRHLEAREGRLFWRRVPGFDGLSLEAGRSGSTMEVTAACRYSPRDPLAKLRYLKAGRRARKTHRTFFRLLYHAFYFPLAWHLETRRGWELLHASAVERRGRGLILAGHGGSGKSTLALSLMADPSVRFISDNLILHDGSRVYSLPEPVRLDPSSLEAIRASGYRPEPSRLPLTAHPKPTYRVEPSRCAAEAEAGAIVLLRFGPRSLVRKMTPGETGAHLVAARDLVREVEGYRSVAAFLSLASEGVDLPGEAAPPRATAAALAARAGSFSMTIGAGESVGKTLARLGEILP